jgi:hypothetical protein
MVIDDLRMGLDPCAFARTVGVDPDAWQADVLRLRSRRMLLNCSRQSGKSTVAAVLALHTAIYRPGSLTLLVSPSLRQSSELFRKVLDVSGKLPARPELAEESKLFLRMQSGSRIVSLPATEATVRGFSGAALIIEDEAARVPDDLYKAVRPMLATSGGALLLMSTPFGKRGHFYEEWENGGSSWERVRIQASECPRIPPAFLQDERRAMGEWWFRQEYGCEFVEGTDGLFTRELIEGAIDDEVKPLFEARPFGEVGTDSGVEPLPLKRYWQ